MVPSCEGVCEDKDILTILGGSLGIGTRCPGLHWPGLWLHLPGPYPTPIRAPSLHSNPSSGQKRD